MLLYRGENKKKKEFSVTEGNNALLNENGPGVYFALHEKRHTAAIYAISNAEIIFQDDDSEEDLPEVLDKGYFYQCHSSKVVDENDENLLNNIHSDRYGEVMASLLIDLSIDKKGFDNLMDSFNFDNAPNSSYTIIPNSTFNNALAYYSDTEDTQSSFYDMIIDLHERMEPDCNKKFVEIILPTIKALGGSMALVKTDQGSIEAVVYDLSSVVIDKEIEITKEMVSKMSQDYIRSHEELSGLIK